MLCVACDIVFGVVQAVYQVFCARLSVHGTGDEERGALVAVQSLNVSLIPAMKNSVENGVNKVVVDVQKLQTTIEIINIVSK